MLAGGGHFLQDQVRKRSNVASSYATWHQALKQYFFLMNVNIDKGWGAKQIPNKHDTVSIFILCRILLGEDSGAEWRRQAQIGCLW